MVIINKNEIIHINLDSWKDIVSGFSNNPVAEGEILGYAKQNKLIIENDNLKYIPIYINDNWIEIEIKTINDLSSLYGLSYHEISKLISNAKIEPIGKFTNLFNEEPFFSFNVLKEGFKEYTSINGLDFKCAALELGLTADSFGKISNQILFNENNKFCKVFLEVFRNKYLDKHTIWSSRSSMLSDFVNRYNALCKNNEERISSQLCEIPSCGHIASAQCTNKLCRGTDMEPRYICTAHEEWIESPDMTKKPNSLCPICAGKVNDGTLNSFKLI